MEIIPILLIVLICAALLLGYPVAFTLAGTSILFAILGIALDFFDPNLFKTLPMRIFGIMIPKIRIGRVLNKLGSKKSNAIPSIANKIEVPARVKATG